MGYIYPERSIHNYVYDATFRRQGPGLGGVNLGISVVSSQIAIVPRLPTARSVHRAKALRSLKEFAIARKTTKSFFEPRVVLDLQLKSKAAFLGLQVDVCCSVVWSCMESC